MLLKGRKWIAIVLCLAVLGLVFYLASVSGEFSNIDSPRLWEVNLADVPRAAPLSCGAGLSSEKCYGFSSSRYVSGVAMLTAIGGAGLWRGAVLTFYNSCRGIVKLLLT